MAARAFIFFDVDDTLVQWNASWVDAFVAAAALVGVTVTPEQALDKLNAAFEGFYRDCIREHASRGDLDAFWSDYDGRILASMGVNHGLRRATAYVLERLSAPDAIQLYPEVPETLDALRQRCARLGIVTGRPRAAPDLERLGVIQHFDPIIDAFAAGGSKSEGRMFHLAAGAAADEGLPAWHVGDSYRDDVQGARAAGLRPVLVDRGNRRPEADCPRITDLRALLELL